MEPSTLKALRLENNLSQEQLAELVGCTQGMISQIESGYAKPSKNLLERIIRVLRPENRLAFVKDQHATKISFKLPKRVESHIPSSLLVQSIVWQRPEYSGDFFLRFPIGRDGIVFVTGDIMGRGRSVFSLSQFTQGWITGYLQVKTDIPRLEEFANSLSTMVSRSDFELSALIVILSKSSSTTSGVLYEAASFGFPLPILLLDTPGKTGISSKMNSSIPFGESPISITRIENLVPPWKLVSASDGLLNRLGNGSESEGKRFLLDWQTSPTRDINPSKKLRTHYPPADDEIFVELKWNKWDLVQECSSSDVDCIRRFMDSIIADSATSVGYEKSKQFARAVIEGISNARRHAYRVQAGRLVLRYRVEESKIRVEIEDDGKGRITKEAIEKPGSGFDIIRHNASKFDVRKSPNNGNIVTLILDK